MYDWVALESFIHEQELHEMAKYLDEVLPKLIRLDYEKSIDGRYRIMVEFDETFVHNAFDWGNDNRMIRYFADYVGRRVEHELKSVNQFRKVNSRKFEV